MQTLKLWILLGGFVGFLPLEHSNFPLIWFISQHTPYLDLLTLIEFVRKKPKNDELRFINTLLINLNDLKSSYTSTKDMHLQ
jgi:hypothetical protein